MARGTERNRRAQQRREQLAGYHERGAALNRRITAAVMELSRRLTPDTPLTAEVDADASEADIGLAHTALLADFLEGCVASVERLDIDLSREDPQ